MSILLNSPWLSFSTFVFFREPKIEQWQKRFFFKNRINTLVAFNRLGWYAKISVVLRFLWYWNPRFERPYADGTTASPVCSLNFESNENNSKFQNQFSGITYDRKDMEEHLQRVGHFDPVTRSVSFTPFQLRFAAFLCQWVAWVSFILEKWGAITARWRYSSKMIS